MHVVTTTSKRRNGTWRTARSNEVKSVLRIWLQPGCVFAENSAKPKFEREPATNLALRYNATAHNHSRAVAMQGTPNGLGD